MVIIFGFLGKSTLEKCIKTLKIDRQSNRKDSRFLKAHSSPSNHSMIMISKKDNN